MLDILNEGKDNLTQGAGCGAQEQTDISFSMLCHWRWGGVIIPNFFADFLNISIVPETDTK